MGKWGLQGWQSVLVCESQNNSPVVTKHLGLCLLRNLVLQRPVVIYLLPPSPRQDEYMLRVCLTSVCLVCCLKGPV